ncbi:MAG: putative transporter ATP-binding protein [Myxococcaceae bacterium]|nr:putative transporter ATP-binding protein [Myxococcaceae bacterium]
MIVVERLCKQYRAGETIIRVLDDVSFRVERGEYVAIMGASGSGKSTLLNVLGLLDSYDSGRYLLDAQDTRELADRAAARMRNRTIGFVFQSFHLLPQKRAWENVALPLGYAGVGRVERRERAHAVLERLGLRERVDHLPNQLSGGQRQRVAIARALVTDPGLLLADEPTGNLDSETTAEVLGLLAEIHDQGRTVVLVTHELEVARAATRIVHVRDGRVVETTAHERAS